MAPTAAKKDTIAQKARVTRWLKNNSSRPCGGMTLREKLEATTGMKLMDYIMAKNVARCMVRREAYGGACKVVSLLECHYLLPADVWTIMAFAFDADIEVFIFGVTKGGTNGCLA